jgi:pyruvate dehydrogenase E1 component beta subunit
MAGAGMNLAAQHSQSWEAFLAHLPGVKVLMPSNAYDAKGMIIAAARDDNPVFVVMNKMSLAMQAEVPAEMYEVPIGKAAVVREGSAFSIFAMGRMVHEALAAAKTLEGLGVDCEVVDVRSIQPFDSQTAVASIKKTHRALIVHEAVRFGGFGGEIVAQLQEQAFDYLDAPIARVGAPFSPVPYSPALEQVYIPNAERIVAEVKKVLGI